jgi:hypothetical protein
MLACACACVRVRVQRWTLSPYLLISVVLLTGRFSFFYFPPFYFGEYSLPLLFFFALWHWFLLLLLPPSTFFHVHVTYSNKTASIGCRSVDVALRAVFLEILLSRSLSSCSALFPRPARRKRKRKKGANLSTATIAVAEGACLV